MPTIPCTTATLHLLVVALTASAAPVGVWQLDCSFALEFEKSVPSFEIQHPLPLETQFQVPLDFEVFVEPEAKRTGLTLRKDDYGNTIAVLAVKPCSKGERMQVEFHAKVLVCPRSYEHLPERVPFPDKWPREVRQWLLPSFCVESTNATFTEIARKVRSNTTDVREAIRRCIRESDEIHWRANKEPPPYSNQTAVHAMQHKVVCTGRANLLAALLRSAGIPARILGGAPARFKSVATHFIVEAYLPGFGWYPIEPTVLAEGLEPQSQINWSIAGPAYESEGNAGWRSYIGGGVPYLSCNEINLPRGAFRYVGAIDDAGADNRATSLLPLESGRKDWKRVMELARQHWKNESKDLATQRSPSSSSLSRFLNKIQ